MGRSWYARRGWLYVPRAWQGWSITLAATAFVAWVFVAVDRRSHSASDTLSGVFPFAACAVLLVHWIGSRTSERSTAREDR